MELPSIVERSSRQQGPQRARQQGPSQGQARRLLSLPLAGLITLLLVGCVGRQASPSRKTLNHSGSAGLHQLNRGRVGAEHRNKAQHE